MFADALLTAFYNELPTTRKRKFEQKDVQHGELPEDIPPEDVFHIPHRYYE